jgi:hypothetical protein
MEDAGEQNLQIITTRDAATVVAKIPKSLRPMCSLDTNLVTDIVIRGSNQFSNEKEYFDQLKSNNPKEYKQLESELLDELSCDSTNKINYLRESKKKGDELEYKNKKEEKQSLERRILYFEENEKSCKNFWNKDGKGITPFKLLMGNFLITFSLFIVLGATDMILVSGHH